MVHFDFIHAAVGIFVVMDALGNLPFFATFLSKMKGKARTKIVRQTMLFASVLLLLFLFFGLQILSFFGITIGSFKIAAGIILLIFGLKIVFGVRLYEKRAEQYTAAVVPLATPLITGPGVITTIIVYTDLYGMLTTLIASVINLIITYLFISKVNSIYRFLGKQGSDALSRIMGLLLTAIAVGFIRTGWLN